VAIKGIGIADDIYVVQTYYDPESYTTPLPSVGDYVIDGFVASDYVSEKLDLPASTFTLSCDAEVINVRAVFSSTFTVSVSAEKFDFASAGLTSSFGFSCNGGLSLEGTTAIASATTPSTNGNQTHGITKTITASATLSGNATVSFKASAQFDAITSTISVGGIIFDPLEEGEQDDYTWDDFAESDVIDRTWNEWFGGKWHPGLIIYSTGFNLNCNGGLVAGGTASLEAVAVASTNANYTARTTKELVSAASIDIDYIRFRGITKTLASAFDETFIGSILHLGSGTFSTAYSFSVDGNATFGPTKAVSGAFAPSVNANVEYDIIKLLTPVSTLQANANVSYKASASFDAFNTTLSFARLITIADPWNILTVPLESRTFVVPVETRLQTVDQETRLNSVNTETRKLQVPQETRLQKIFKPTFKNRSSIPKVRSEA